MKKYLKYLVIYLLWVLLWWVIFYHYSKINKTPDKQDLDAIHFILYSYILGGYFILIKYLSDKI